MPVTKPQHISTNEQPVQCWHLAGTRRIRLIVASQDACYWLRQICLYYIALYIKTTWCKVIWCHWVGLLQTRLMNLHPLSYSLAKIKVLVSRIAVKTINYDWCDSLLPLYSEYSCRCSISIYSFSNWNTWHCHISPLYHAMKLNFWVKYSFLHKEITMKNMFNGSYDTSHCAS